MEQNWRFTYMTIYYLPAIAYLPADEMDFIFGEENCLNNMWRRFPRL